MTATAGVVSSGAPATAGALEIESDHTKSGPLAPEAAGA